MSDNSNKKIVLVISYCLGYKNVAHAGGKTHYHYIKKIEDMYQLIVFAPIKKEQEPAISQEKKIKFIKFENKKLSLFFLILNKIYDVFDVSVFKCFISFKKLHNYKKQIKALKKDIPLPDVIILDWTQCVFLSKFMRKIYPTSKIICVEQDVAFLSFARRIELAKNCYERIKAKKHFDSVKRVELKALTYADKINVFNYKDAKLLVANDVLSEKIKIIAPYFDDYSMITRKSNNTNIFFYGAMERPENYECCIWFIENVFTKLPESFTFTIIGANPHKMLEKYRSERIRITGFVDDVSPFFESALCCVVPLLLGAGIKVKVLEAMSAGIPVLTNSIGIEGIPAQDKKDFLFCESVSDWISKINMLACDESLQEKICENAREFVKNTFDYQSASYI